MLRVGASARRSLIEKAAEAAAQSLHRQAALRLQTVSMIVDVVEGVGRGEEGGGGAPGRFSLLEGSATVKSGRGGTRGEEVFFSLPFGCSSWGEETGKR